MANIGNSTGTLKNRVFLKRKKRNTIYTAQEGGPDPRTIPLVAPLVPAVRRLPRPLDNGSPYMVYLCPRVIPLTFTSYTRPHRLSSSHVRLDAGTSESRASRVHVPNYIRRRLLLLKRFFAPSWAS